MARKSQRGSSHASKHNYLRPELWANGKCAFYLNSPHHNYEKYREFHERQIAEAQRQNRL